MYRCVHTQTHIHTQQTTPHSEPVAFVDVLGPPYNPKMGRDCTYYYREAPSDSDETVDKEYALL